MPIPKSHNYINYQQYDDCYVIKNPIRDMFVRI